VALLGFHLSTGVSSLAACKVGKLKNREKHGKIY